MQHYICHENHPSPSLIPYQYRSASKQNNIIESICVASDSSFLLSGLHSFILLFVFALRKRWWFLQSTSLYNVLVMVFGRCSLLLFSPVKMMFYWWVECPTFSKANVQQVGRHTTYLEMSALFHRWLSKHKYSCPPLGSVLILNFPRHPLFFLLKKDLLNSNTHMSFHITNITMIVYFLRVSQYR